MEKTNTHKQHDEPDCLHVGLDIGSTTVKAVVLNPKTGEILHRLYQRHHARLAKSTAGALEEIARQFPRAPLKIAVTGSGGAPIAQRLGAPFVQEVVANAAAVQKLHPQVRTAIELGGQDAKIVFFSPDEVTGRPEVSDMRMNGSCAGGTGAFLDEIAALLNVKSGTFDELAAKGATVHSVSGRCGVFAKTDIQPLIAAGAPKEDLALSAFHAIAKQTIGGLAQGRTIEAPVLFEGGPLLFNPTLVRVFSERLGLQPHEAVLPDHPETIVALGAAFLLASNLKGKATPIQAQDALEALSHAPESSSVASAAPLFADESQRAEFYQCHAKDRQAPGPRAGHVRAYLGIDSGSTTTKIVLLGEDGQLLDSSYASNEGDPLAIAQKSLKALRERWRAAGGRLEIAGAGATGYGEKLFAKAYRTDVSLVETVAHARAALAHTPDATFVLDIGGQDMKALWVNDGVITDIVVNEACSSGCGSFLEGFASSLGIAREDMAEAAFASASPASLGSRCTVFMNSNVITAQRAGKNPRDIMAGLALSVVENVFTKVIRASNLDSLGERVVVQGGTFANDAVLRAFERYLGRNVARTPYPGLAGAIGAALAAKEHAELSESEGGGTSGGGGASGAGADSENGSTGTITVDGADSTSATAIGDAGNAGGSNASSGTFRSSFIGLDAAVALAATRENNVVCPLCANHCARTIVRFSNGDAFVTGNRCSRGEELGDDGIGLDDGEQDDVKRDDGQSGTQEEAGANAQRTQHVQHARLAKEQAGHHKNRRAPNLFKKREQLLFKDYAFKPILPAGSVTIGLPRVLSLWDNAPFWSTLFRSLGFQVRFSEPSTREKYEQSLCSIASDTACFPAKLAHGHVRDLAEQKVDRIFMPVITAVKPEGTSPKSESMCALVKGTPLVVRSSDDLEKTWGIPFDTPLFHWHTDADRQRQLTAFLKDTLGIAPEHAQAAIAAGDAAQREFKESLEALGAETLARMRAEGSFAVVLASRPYQNDPIVCHDIPSIFADLGIVALPVDALPGLNQVRLTASRLDIANNYHARMLAGALYAASSECLEYVQIVSFGCGHDAYLTDEIARLMQSAAEKPHLVLKVDESDVRGPLDIRIRSFVETVSGRRRREEANRHARPIQEASPQLQQNPQPQTAHQADPHPQAAQQPDPQPTQPAMQARHHATPALPDPYPVKFRQEDRTERTVLVPNTSHAFGRLMAAVFSKQGLRAVPLDLGGEEAIRLGKRYTHNDVCFPAQMVIGEVLAALESGQYDPRHTAVGMAKYIGDCRLTHYSALLRKALDDAGYAQIPIITNDGEDERGLHPGFKMSIASALRIAFCLPMIDALEELLRKMRPYEKESGSADNAFERALDRVIEGVSADGMRGAKRGFEQAIRIMRDVEFDRSRPRARVLIVGEYLLNFHPGANRNIERYLESNGMEIVEARMTDVIRKTYFYQHSQVREFGVEKPFSEKALLAAADAAFEVAHDVTDRIARAHPLYEPPCRMPDLVKASDPIIHHTFDAGEGVLIPAEILHHYQRGVRAFVILQPFGCLPNHIVGRGIVKSLRKQCPNAQILALDYDPDASPANIENRLQMLIMRSTRAD